MPVGLLYYRVLLQLYCWRSPSKFLFFSSGRWGRRAHTAPAIVSMAHAYDLPTLLPVKLEPANAPDHASLPTRAARCQQHAPVYPTLRPVKLEPAHAPDHASLPTRAARCQQLPSKLTLSRAPSSTSSAASRAGTPERWGREECEEYEERMAAGREERAAWSDAPLVLAVQLACVQLVLVLAWCAVVCAPALRASAVGAWQLLRVVLAGLCAGSVLLWELCDWCWPSSPAAAVAAVATFAWSMGAGCSVQSSVVWGLVGVALVTLCQGVCEARARAAEFSRTLLD